MRIRKTILCIVLIILLGFMPNVYATDSGNKINVEIGSKAGILMDARTGEILFEKDSNSKYYPASTTKVMTALLVLENISNLQEVATVSYNAIFSIPKGYSTNLLHVGEELTIENLLYALLVKSSNESAVVLAEYLSGNVESFATLMNTRASELGCLNTHFVNPNGVQDENHYSTAYDLSLIAREAMKNETFRKIVSTASYTLPSTNKYDRIDRNLITTNDIIRSSSKYYYEYAIGIKTGYTSSAKNCLIAGASKNGIELIAVVLGADKQDSKGNSVRDVDVKNLFESVYNNFSDKTVVQENGIINTVKVSGATKATKNLNLLAKEKITALVTNDRVKSVEIPEIILNEKIKAPIKKGEVIGVAKYTINGIEYGTSLLAANDVKKSYSFYIVLGIIIIALIFFSGYKKKIKNNKKYKKKNKYTYKYQNKYRNNKNKYKKTSYRQ